VNTPYTLLTLLAAALDSMSTPENIAILAIGAGLGIMLSLLCALPWLQWRRRALTRSTQQQKLARADYQRRLAQLQSQLNSIQEDMQREIALRDAQLLDALTNQTRAGGEHVTADN
jgi:C4-dicarboxylate-specific signal transduction histidine kinase